MARCHRIAGGLLDGGRVLVIDLSGLALCENDRLCPYHLKIKQPFYNAASLSCLHRCSLLKDLCWNEGAARRRHRRDFELEM